MPVKSIVPAVLSYRDGVPCAPLYDDVYHSDAGGAGQAQHVFLGGNGLPVRWREREQFSILENGFGLGLNFLTTWAEWRNDPHAATRLHYLAIEKHPFRAEDLAVLHATWPQFAGIAEQLRAAWPPLMPGWHRLVLAGGRLTLTLVFGDVADCLPQVQGAFDAFYLDGFSPAKNPDMWAPALLSRLHRLAAPEATAATYTVASSVRKALAQAGFVCEKLPGFGDKRDMLAARFAPRWPQTARKNVSDRRAIVLGAGLAGSAACERLAARGWQVTLIERHAQPAQETSGNRAGIVMPLLSRDDNLVSQLARAAYLFALRYGEHLGGVGRAFAGAVCGVLQLASDPEQAELQQQMAGGADTELVRWLDKAVVRQDYGIDIEHGGLLFERGGWITPASLCEAMLRACGDRLQRRFDSNAVGFDYANGLWSVRDANNALLAEAPVLILANGCAASRFAQTCGLPLKAMRGQVTDVPASALPASPLVVCGDGYVTPPVDGICSVGASYDEHDDPNLRLDSQQENLARLSHLLPGVPDLRDLPLAGRVGFRCVSPDRLPLAGALPDEVAQIAGSRLRDVPRLPGLYGLLAYGSRGLIWAPLLAELLAAQLESEPFPLERTLVEALDPARFALKVYRHAS